MRLWYWIIYKLFPPKPGAEIVGWVKVRGEQVVLVDDLGISETSLAFWLKLVGANGMRVKIVVEEASESR